MSLTTDISVESTQVETVTYVNPVGDCPIKECGGIGYYLDPGLRLPEHRVALRRSHQDRPACLGGGELAANPREDGFCAEGVHYLSEGECR